MDEPICKDSHWADNVAPDYMRKRAEVMKLSLRVDKMVRKRFALVRKLVIHSYYEADFLEAALNRAVLTYEMALRRQYRRFYGSESADLNVAAPDEPEELHNLIGKAHTRGLLGTAEGPAQALRDVRNWIAHPETHSGLGFMSWRLLLRVAEHIEGLYEDPQYRLQRSQETARLNKRLAHLAEIGAVLSGEALIHAKRGAPARFKALANPVARRRYENGFLNSNWKSLKNAEPDEAKKKLKREVEASRSTYEPMTSKRWLVASARVLHAEQRRGEESTFYIGFVPVYPSGAEPEDGPVVFPHLMVCTGWESLSDGSLRFDTKAGSAVLLDRSLTREERDLCSNSHRDRSLQGRITLNAMKGDIEGRDSILSIFSLGSAFLIA